MIPGIVRVATPLAAGAVLLGCLLPPPAGPWLLAAGAALLPVALMAVAARCHGTTRRVRLVFLALALLLAGTLALLIRFHGAGTTGASGLLLQLLGLWFLPLLLSGLGYAVTFAPSNDSRGADSDGPEEGAR